MNGTKLAVQLKNHKLRKIPSRPLKYNQAMNSPNSQPIIITQNGEAKAILENLKEYEKTQEALAMLKIVLSYSSHH